MARLDWEELAREHGAQETEAHDEWRARPAIAARINATGTHFQCDACHLWWLLETRRTCASCGSTLCALCDGGGICCLG